MISVAHFLERTRLGPVVSGWVTFSSAHCPTHKPHKLSLTCHRKVFLPAYAKHSATALSAVCLPAITLEKRGEGSASQREDSGNTVELDSDPGRCLQGSHDGLLQVSL